MPVPPNAVRDVAIMAALTIGAFLLATRVENLVATIAGWVLFVILIASDVFFLVALVMAAKRRDPLDGEELWGDMLTGEGPELSAVAERLEENESLRASAVGTALVALGGQGAVAIGALDRVSDSQRVADIAARAIDPEVASAALDRVDGQDALRSVAIESRSGAVSASAASRLTRPTDLEAVAKAVSWEEVWNLLLATTSDAMSVVDLAIAKREEKVGLIVAQGIESRAALERLGCDHPSIEVRRSALAKISDQAVLTRVALGHDDPLTRVHAEECVTDPALRAQIEEAREQARREAAEGAERAKVETRRELQERYAECRPWVDGRPGAVRAAGHDFTSVVEDGGHCFYCHETISGQTVLDLGRQCRKCGFAIHLKCQGRLFEEAGGALW